MFLLRATFLSSIVMATAFADLHPLEDMSPILAGFNTGGVSNSSRGWRFLANDNVTVTELGASTPHPEGNAFSVMLWDFASQNKLGQLDFISDGSDNWQWANLTTPINLISGSEYIVSMYTRSASYYFLSIGGPWQPTGTIQYRDMRYANGATDSTFPTSVLSGYQYGVPDIGYHLTAIAPVPEPSTYALLLVGAGAFLIRKRF